MVPICHPQHALGNPDILLGRKVIYETTCISTNSFAMKHGKKSRFLEGTVILTDRQQQGRGQRGKSWLSEPGKNLTFSVVLYPDFLAVRQGFELSMMVSLAIQHVLMQYIPNNLTIKWPNDVYYQNQKLGGILIETVSTPTMLQSAVVGIGLNVNQTTFPFKQAASLATICGYYFFLPTLLTLLLEAIERYYFQLKKRDLAPLQEAYYRHLYWKDMFHTFQDQNQCFQGAIRGIDEIGRLVIEHAHGQIVSYGSQEIDFIA